MPDKISWKTNHCDLCFHYNKTMTVRMSKVSQSILHILRTSLIATIVFVYHHLKYCFCKCYSYPCFYFLTLWVRNASCFAGNVTGWNIGQEFQTRVGNSSVNPFTWTRVGAYPRNIHQRIYLKSTKKTFNFSGKKQSIHRSKVLKCGNICRKFVPIWLL